MLEVAVGRLLEANEMLFMQQIEPLSAYQLNFLKAIAAGNHDGFTDRETRSNYDLGSPSNIVRLKDALIDKDLIYSEMKKIYITDPVLQLWIQRRFL